MDAIKARVAQNLDRGYRNRNLYILSVTQVAIKAPDNYQTNTNLVWNCHQSLAKLAEHNRVQLIWVMKVMKLPINWQ
jgi:hypothetical protein